ncbi:unnamed protein product [Closterium sp. NIES-65]|nr:unnamed protein product [Closterium sp. NIES-65]
MSLLLCLRSLSSYVVYRFPASPTLRPTVAHASSRCRSHFIPSFAHAPPPVTTFTVALAFPHCRLRSHPSSLTTSPYLLPRFHSHQPRFLPPSSSSSHRRPPFSPTSLHVVITPLPITFPLFTVASPPSHPFPSHLGLSPTLGGEVWRAGLGAGKGVVARSLWGVEGCVVSSTHPFLSCTDLLSSLAPTPHAWEVVMRLWSRVLGAQPGQRAQAGSKECSAAGGGPPIISSPIISSPLSSHPPSISSPHHLIRPSSHPPIISSIPHHLIPPSSHPPSSHPPIISSPNHLIPPSSHPPIFSSPHHLIRPSSHPPIISSPHHLIPPSSHPPIISSPHHLIRPSSHPPIISSAHHLIRPSSVSPLLIFCLRASLFPTVHQSLWFVSMQVCHASSRDEYRV